MDVVDLKQQNNVPSGSESDSDSHSSEEVNKPTVTSPDYINNVVRLPANNDVEVDMEQHMPNGSESDSDSHSSVEVNKSTVSSPDYINNVVRPPANNDVEVDMEQRMYVPSKYVSTAQLNLTTRILNVEVDMEQQMPNRSQSVSDYHSSEEVNKSTISSSDNINNVVRPPAPVEVDMEQQMPNRSQSVSDYHSSVEVNKSTISSSDYINNVVRPPANNEVEVDMEQQMYVPSKYASTAQLNLTTRILNIEGDFNVLDVIIPGPDRYKRHSYNSKKESELINRIENEKTGNVYIGEVDVNNVMSGYGRLCSRDEKQYVIGEWENNRLTKLIFCQFNYATVNNRDCYARLYGDDKLLTLDRHNYIARVNIRNLERDFSCIALTPSAILQNVCVNLTIVKVIEDKMSLDRDIAYNNFSQFLQNIKCKTANTIESAEDCIQLYKTFVRNKNSSYNRNTAVLNDLLNNKYISSKLRDVTSQLIEVESGLHERNRFFPQFDVVQLQGNDLSKEIENVCAEGVVQHKHHLIDKCSTQSFSTLIPCLNQLSRLELLYVCTGDIVLISDLITTTHEYPYPTNEVKDKYTPILLDIITKLCNILIQQIKSLTIYDCNNATDNVVAPLTRPVYLYIYKHFLEVTIEISSVTNSACDLMTKEKGKWELQSEIDWPTSLLKHRVLEYQFRYFFSLLEYFSPRDRAINKKKTGFVAKMKNFLLGDKTKTTTKSDTNDVQGIAQNTLGMFTEAQYWLLGDNGKNTNLTEDHLLWLGMLVGVTVIINEYHKEHHKESEQDIQRLAEPLLNTFKEFLIRNENQFESIRITAKNMIKFVTYIGSSIESSNSFSSDVAKELLQGQISHINKFVLSSQGQYEPLDYFPTLMSVFIGFWECWESIQPVVERFPYGAFKEAMCDISTGILQLAVDALNMETVTLPVLIDYFRALIEFIKHLDRVDFTWFVKKDSNLVELSVEIVKEVDADKKSCEVLKPTEFMKIYASGNKECPKHHVIKVIDTLLSVLRDCLLKEVTGTDWNRETHVNATSKLFLIIGRSFLHFKEQTKYVDFEQFLIDCTQPFRNVVEDRTSYARFVKRIDNLETFYLYTRKQEEIGITQALNLFKTEAERLPISGFDASFDEAQLKTCYDKYSEQFNLYIQETESNVNKIGIIKNAVDEQVKSANGVQIGDWTTEFKMSTLPLILAGLASVWSIHNSTDIESTGMSLKPHCIQILCILRLLNVDKATIGVENHLAQILTGQGKSVVLALFGTILALLGYPVRVVCYSKYLADRDKQDFKEFFSEFGVSSNIVYGTFKDMATEILSPEIEGSKRDLRSLVKQCALNTLEDLNAATARTVDRPSAKVLLIDEVDVFFSDQFYGDTYNPCVHVGMSALVDIQTSIWDAVTSGLHTHEAVAKKIDELVDRKIKDANNGDDIFVDFYCTTEYLFKKNVTTMIDNAIKVATGNAGDWTIMNCKLNDDGLICRKDSSGNYCPYTSSEYFNVFNYFRLKGKDYDHKNYQNFGYITISCGKISYADLPKEYSIISGVSGTLTTLNDSEKQAIESYDVHHMSSMPSFFGATKLVFKENEHLTITSSKDDWLTAIHRNVSSNIQSGRAVLVFFDIDSVINEFSDKYKSSYARLHVLTGIEEKTQLEWFISEAGVAGTVTLATRVMGRGVDFKSYDSSVEAKGGVHVIQTFFSLDEKEETQIKGRTARKSNRGSYELILCEKHLNKENLIEGNNKSYKSLSCRREVMNKSVGNKNAENIRVSLEKHEQTIQFMNSFFQYTKNKRTDYLEQAAIVAL